MNFQNANSMIFFGMSDSWESYYQSIRREWRFGQTKPVNVYLLLSEFEREIYENVMRKEAQAIRLREKMIERMKNYEKEELENIEFQEAPYLEETIKGNGWTAMKGDSVTRINEIADDSIDLSIYSPPFADLFVYSNSERDLGNCRGWDEFFSHYDFIIKGVLRITKPGRLSCVHASDVPAMANRDGYIGLRDFPGEVIRAHEKCGWTFVGRAYIQKNPQAQAIRVKSKALLFVQINKDSSHSRPALIDQILIFKKPGDNVVPIRPVKNRELDNETWISWAHGIWTDINETETLQYYCGRDKDDEKHICPLQLGTIERCIKLYSNIGETVFTPFMGIGSEAYVAYQLGREAIGIELKDSYFKIAVANLQKASIVDLFS
jgi:DNA modification methylase